MEKVWRRSVTDWHLSLSKACLCFLRKTDWSEAGRSSRTTTVPAFFATTRTYNRTSRMYMTWVLWVINETRRDHQGISIILNILQVMSGQDENKFQYTSKRDMVFGLISNLSIGCTRNEARNPNTRFLILFTSRRRTHLGGWRISLTFPNRVLNRNCSMSIIS